MPFIIEFVFADESSAGHSHSARCCQRTWYVHSLMLFIQYYQYRVLITPSNCRSGTYQLSEGSTYGWPEHSVGYWCNASFRSSSEAKKGQTTLIAFGFNSRLVLLGNKSKKITHKVYVLFHFIKEICGDNCPNSENKNTIAIDWVLQGRNWLNLWI